MLPYWLPRTALAAVALAGNSFGVVDGYEGSTTRTVSVSCTDCGRGPFRPSNADGDFSLHFTIAENLRRLQLGFRTIYPLDTSEEVPFYIPQLISSSSRSAADISDSKPIQASVSRIWTGEEESDGNDPETVILKYHIDSTEVQCLASEDIAITLSRSHVGTLRIVDIAFITDEQTEIAESVFVDEFDDYHTISHRTLPNHHRAFCASKVPIDPMAWFPPMQRYHMTHAGQILRTMLENLAALITSVPTAVVIGMVVLAFAMAIDQILRSSCRKWRRLRGYQSVALRLDLEAAKPQSLSIAAHEKVQNLHHQHPRMPIYQAMCRRASEPICRYQQ